ncbi:MAG: H-X9-DG-CTERM domain-containing protein [Armatimonadota bacterium]|jgi:prepilin-type processing-associated H-X9-DG protein
MVGETDLNRVTIYAPLNQSFIDTYVLERNAHDRHNGGSNYTFVDGHSKWLQSSATTTLASLNELWVAQRD